MSELDKLKEALQDLTDGMSAHDMVANTGLPLERCREILDLVKDNKKIIEKSAYEGRSTESMKLALYEVPEGKWSGKNPIPKIGDEVRINFNNLGRGMVVAYHYQAGYIGVEVKMYKRPAWHIKQNGDTYPNALVFGSELC